MRGSSALFCEFLRAINDEQRGNSGRRAGNGARVQSLRQLGTQARHAPMDAAMPGEATGYVLRAASAPAQSAAAAASTRLANRILCYPYQCHAIQRVAPTKAMLIDRRRILAVLAGSFATPAFFVPAFAQAPAMTRVTAYAFSFGGLEGPDIRLADHAGKPILVVNTASLCGFTPQYAGLQQLWTRYHGRGLMIVGVPSNDFGGQEPGGTADIMRTAHGEYGIGFPLAAKAQVKGANPHPFYKWAAAERPLETPRWNFHKYLVGRDGHIAAVFATDIEPMDARVIDAIVKELPPPE